MKKLALISLVLAFLSCEDARVFELESFEKEMVLNAIISTDSTWDVSLSYTQSIFDEQDFELVDDAEVRVLNLTNGQSFFLDKRRTGNYARELSPVEGHEYQLSVNVPGREELMAQTYVPSVLEVNVFSNLVENVDGSSNIEINIEIEDNPQEENYYVWELLPISSGVADNVNAAPISTRDETNDSSDVTNGDGNIGQGNGDGNTNPKFENELTSDKIYSFNLGENEESEYQQKELSAPAFLSEADVRAGKIANKLILDSSLISEIDSEYEVIDSEEIESRQPLFELNIMAVSSDLYEYLRSYEDYKQREIKNTSFSDPVIIHSNIDNGLGIFGGFNLKTFYIY